MISVGTVDVSLASELVGLIILSGQWSEILSPLRSNFFFGTGITTSTTCFVGLTGTFLLLGDILVCNGTSSLPLDNRRCLGRLLSRSSIISCQSLSVLLLTSL